MKKISFLGLAALLAFTLMLGSCTKDNPGPIVDKEASVAINGISVQKLVGNYETYVLGYASFVYFIADSTGAIVDSTYVTNTFEVENPNAWNQVYDFDMPKNTKKLRVGVYFKILGQGYAESITVNQLLIKKSGVTVLDKPLNVVGTIDKTNFSAQSETVTF